MNDKFYSAYSAHCLRFYCRYDQPKLNSKIDELNWNACNRAFQRLEQEDQNLLKRLFQDDIDITTVNQAAHSASLTPESIWKKIRKLERYVAEERGLI